MSLQGNGRNHNHKPKLNNDNDVIKEGIDVALQYQNKSGEKVKAYSPEQDVDFASPVDRDKRIKEASEKEHASAYDDLDDYVYRQNKKRHRRRHRRTSLSVGVFRKKRRSQHKHRHHQSKHRHHRKRWKTWQKVAVSCICVMLALILGLVGVIFYLYHQGEKELLTKNVMISTDIPKKVIQTDNGRYLTVDGQTYKYNENITSILCMGIDKETLATDGEIIGTGGSSDLLFIVAIDTSNGEVKMLNISRDIVSEIDIYSSDNKFVRTSKPKEYQICLAYAYGDGKTRSCQNQVRAVRRFLYNIPIQSYMSLDLDGIGVINDAIGGITVTSPETIGPFVSGQTVTLRGAMAQTFVRQRRTDILEGNTLRMERQRQYIQKFAAQLMSKTKKNLQTPLDLYNVAKPYICTNLNSKRITYLSMKAIQGKIDSNYEIKTFEGELKAGDEYAELHVTKDTRLQMLLDIYYEPVS